MNFFPNWDCAALLLLLLMLFSCISKKYEKKDNFLTIIECRNLNEEQKSLENIRLIYFSILFTL